MNRLKRVWRRIRSFATVLIQTAGVLSAVLTILTVLGVGSATFGYFNHLLPLMLSGTAVFLLSGLIFIFLYTFLEEKMKLHPLSTDTIRYPSPPHDEGFEILLKEIVYEYSSDGQTMWQRKRLHMRALYNGIDHFTDRYRWTGSGKCIVRSLTSGFSISNQRKEEFWDYFDVNFPRALHRGEEVDFTIEWELFDAEKIALPFLTTLIDRETKHLSLQVILPRELAPTRAYSHEFANNVDTLPIETQPIKWSPASQRISYEVPHPKKYHKYSIRWYYD